MSLQKKFDSALRNAIGARAVWLPGSPITVGDILVRRDGGFSEGGSLADFGIEPRIAAHAPINGVNLRSTKTRQSIFQLGAEVTNIEAIADDIEAKVKYEFNGETEFIAKTPKLTGDSIQNMIAIASQLAGDTRWKHDKYFIVEQSLGAEDWSFIGTDKTSRNFEFSGKGSAIKQFLTVGASVGLSKTTNVTLDLSGVTGNIGMKLVRIRKDGTLNHGS